MRGRRSRQDGIKSSLRNSSSLSRYKGKNGNVFTRKTKNSQKHESNLSDDDSQGNFSVEMILAYNPESKLYLVKWETFCWSAVTWEPYENIKDCKDFIEYNKDRDKLLSKLKNTPYFCKLKPFLYPKTDEQYINIFGAFSVELAIRNCDEDLPPIYVVNWVDYQIPPEFSYVSNIIIKPKFAEDINIIDQVEPCSNCKAEKETDYCEKYKEHFLKNHINFNVKEVRMSCSDLCKCLKNPCPTRVADTGRTKRLIIAKTIDKGWGLFAGDNIKAGEFICEYAGELISRCQAVQRKNDYIFDMDYMCGHESDHFGNAKFAIDAYKYGNEGRFANHSCNPNARAISIYSQFKCEDYHKIGFFAKQSIQFGDEITIDYFGAEVESNTDRFSMVPCNCGAANCRKYIPIMDSLTKKKINGVRGDTPEVDQQGLNKLGLVELNEMFIPEKFYKVQRFSRLKKSENTPTKDKSNTATNVGDKIIEKNSSHCPDSLKKLILK
ncbi:Chromo domain/shadow and SET domain and Post-SET domain and Chromo domain-like and Chromo domain-containing protein [Strongyloides ratti]|uniref:Chromo domain/shadow and SET domain and Post-SET domain and Chromo domain-like and Chromo domain-containing protein n=1 Tax=Strongyloides ratti TaxID=34506 RepID=A0A090LD22_STRRB|nr:Chromo domain/shadow and SET domain and Post-SET domain and Chromo domain-like and Chromo domain-containing protein [Strongyloides ratti]CEF67652.1 Chromo domain/shadow and SET domain and Post-SET domain and Chromo domain-like and Chromo domain-containing protein [Strongyloides ratti]